MFILVVLISPIRHPQLEATRQKGFGLVHRFSPLPPCLMDCLLLHKYIHLSILDGRLPTDAVLEEAEATTHSLQSSPSRKENTISEIKHTNSETAFPQPWLTRIEEKQTYSPQICFAGSGDDLLHHDPRFCDRGKESRTNNEDVSGAGLMAAGVKHDMQEPRTVDKPVLCNRGYAHS